MTAPPGHPEPEPVPTPEPDHPQPIPLPEPVPAPEPPHESAPAESASLAAASLDAADFIDAPPAAAEAVFPPPGAFPDERSAPTADLSAPTAEPTRQMGVVPDLYGPTAQVAAAPDQSEPTEQIPAVAGLSAATEQIAPVGERRPDTWQQPVSTEPFHAQHEKPGEWQHAPPEHLAFEHSSPAEVQDNTQVVRAVPQPQWEVPLTADDADRRRRTGLWISVALTTTLLLCGGGAASAYLLLRDSDSTGAPDPATAVNEFMTAVYTRQDSAAAGELVCRESRDPAKLAARIEQVKGYAAEYDAPSFRWAEPAVDTQDEERATVSVQLTMSTEDEKTAQQQLTFTTVRKSGWLVCEITG